jgi:WbqC-like protein family
MIKDFLLPACYFGPLQFYSKFVEEANITIEQYDSYNKQSFRNRCVIYGANGLLSLSIPVIKNHGRKTLMKDIQIDYATNWQKIHLGAISAAYKSSAFYEYYFDDYSPFFHKKTKFLLDLNMQLHEITKEFLSLKNPEKLSQKFQSVSDEIDFRDIIHPKRNPEDDPYFRIVEYFQVFREKYGFQENLSILDLLFNEGPIAPEILSKSFVRRWNTDLTEGTDLH